MTIEALISLIGEKSAGHEKVVVALSGGVDSGLVAFATRQALGDHVVAATIDSELTISRDLTRAVAVAEHIGIAHTAMPFDLLDVPGVRSNGPDRCYHCKRAIFGALVKTFGQDCLILDGTNKDDDQARPGLRAVKEFGVFSPLYKVGLVKSGVRELAREAGLPNWNSPSESCLANRIPRTIPLDSAALSRVETMEAFFHDQGVETLRVKHDNLMAIVEYLPQYSDIIVQNSDKFMALVERIGLRSCEFKEWKP